MNQNKVKELVNAYNSWNPDSVESNSPLDGQLSAMNITIAELGYQFYRDDTARVWVASPDGKVNGHLTENAIYPDDLSPRW